MPLPAASPTVGLSLVMSAGPSGSLAYARACGPRSPVSEPGNTVSSRCSGRTIRRSTSLCQLWPVSLLISMPARM